MFQSVDIYTYQSTISQKHLYWGKVCVEFSTAIMINAIIERPIWLAQNCAAQYNFRIRRPHLNNISECDQISHTMNYIKITGEDFQNSNHKIFSLISLCKSYRSIYFEELGSLAIMLMVLLSVSVSSSASYQIRKIADCACAGNDGNVLPAVNFKWNRYFTIPACITRRASRTCCDACRDR